MQYKVIASLGDSLTQGAFDETGNSWFGRFAARISAGGGKTVSVP